MLDVTARLCGGDISPRACARRHGQSRLADHQHAIRSLIQSPLENLWVVAGSRRAATD